MKVTLQSALLAQFLCLGAAQFTEPPPSTADPSTIKDCTWWFVAGASDTCDRVTATYGITQAQLVRYNPILSSSCTFITGNSYCIEQNWGAEPEPEPQPPTGAPGSPTTLTTTTRAATTTTAPGNGIATPQPIQPGMVTNCNKFYWVDQGVSCSQVLSSQQISLADFAKWNPAVGIECTGMWAEVNVCVGVIGGSAPTTTSKPLTTTTTAAGNGVQTPQPTQPGMVTNCNKFHWIAQGVSCSQVISYQKISLADFVKWNPTVGNDCSGMWAEVNVCVGVIGGSAPSTTTKPPVTTTAPAGNGVQTPQPTQPGMVTNCNKFHWIAQGVNCNQVISYQKISLADFVKWNPTVGNDCTGMWANVNVCVGVIGGSTPTTTTKPTTTTTAGNGVQTPQPTQPGMVTNCKKFHYVSEGNTCGQIISYQKITLANFVKWNTGVGSSCQNMWAKTYVCVGV
ncbi:LysM domain-containing protein [Colletotrichum truncatum]|uniref:LysM domain-containing protein n=1 Tax=Colletotrichum truncatum TaxID=5467 RepID=A0ACC3Z8S4_COLTU|nr:LysM domain-containing protein [Colletotrichum truncatum]KAF6789293.1 LysM domain-containing protein [Colletotrichum truncatum]